MSCIIHTNQSQSLVEATPNEPVVTTSADIVSTGDGNVSNESADKSIVDQVKCTTEADRDMKVELRPNTKISVIHTPLDPDQNCFKSSKVSESKEVIDTNSNVKKKSNVKRKSSVKRNYIRKDRPPKMKKLGEGLISKTICKRRMLCHTSFEDVNSVDVSFFEQEQEIILKKINGSEFVNEKGYSDNDGWTHSKRFWVAVKFFNSKRETGYSQTEICKILGVSRHVIKKFRLKGSINDLPMYSGLSPIEMPKIRNKFCSFFKKNATNYQLLIENKLLKVGKSIKTEKNKKGKKKKGKNKTDKNKTEKNKTGKNRLIIQNE